MRLLTMHGSRPKKPDFKNPLLGGVRGGFTGKQR